jgi:two-component system, OmpR family, phosphate regulon sensor histidine kinase PhoR
MILDSGKVLILDKDNSTKTTIKAILNKTGHFEIHTTGSKEEASRLGTGSEYDLYFLELSLLQPGQADSLTHIRESFPESICIVMCATPSTELAWESGKLGAYAILNKPLKLIELSHIIHRALERRWYILDSRRLRAEKSEDLKEIAREKTRLKSVIQSIDDGIVIIDSKGELTFYNPRFLRILGISQEISNGTQAKDFLPKALWQSVQKILQIGCKDETIRQEITAPHDDDCYLMANTTPVCDNGKNLLGVISVLRDITPIRKAEMYKSHFVRMLAHELKAPLAAIEGYLDVIVNKSLGDEPDIYENYLNRSLERAKSMRDLINDLLNIFKLQAPQRTRKEEIIHLKTFINELIGHFEGDIKRRDITVLQRINEPDPINADTEDMTRVFNNILSNAIKYNRFGGQIYIWGKREGDTYRLTVEDTGIGMSESEQSSLFIPFYRAKNSYTRTINGTGLGLSIVKRTLEDYGARISVESQFQKGTSIHIDFPLEKNSEAGYAE